MSSIGPMARTVEPSGERGAFGRRRGAGGAGSGGWREAAVDPKLRERAKDATQVVQSESLYTLKAAYTAGQLTWKNTGRVRDKPISLPANTCVSRAMDTGVACQVGLARGAESIRSVPLPLLASFGSLSMQESMGRIRMSAKCVVTQPRSPQASFLWNLIAGRCPHFSLIIATAIQTRADVCCPLPTREPWVLMAAEHKVEEDGTAPRRASSRRWLHEDRASWCSPMPVCMPLGIVAAALQLRRRINRCIATRAAGRGRRVPYIRPDPGIVAEAMDLVFEAQDRFQGCCETLWEAAELAAGGGSEGVKDEPEDEGGKGSGKTKKKKAKGSKGNGKSKSTSKGKRPGSIIAWAAQAGCELGMARLESAVADVGELAGDEAGLSVGAHGTSEPERGASAADPFGPMSGAGGDDERGRFRGSGRRAADFEQESESESQFLVELSADGLLAALAHFFRVAARLQSSEFRAFSEQGAALMRSCAEVAGALDGRGGEEEEGGDALERGDVLLAAPGAQVVAVVPMAPA